jgi:septum formation protein
VDGSFESRPRAQDGPRLWRGESALILASKSEGRRLALQQTAIPFETCPAKIDERSLEQEILSGGGGPDQVVAGLARAKALEISRSKPARYVVGADQAASSEGRLFGKPADPEEARRQLAFLSGRKHRLHSALALACDGKILFETVRHADMTMRALSDEFLDVYLALMGETALNSAGAYQVEGLGVHLFSEIAGDHWTILGLPLLPLLDALRRAGVLQG